ncbi:MAG: hydroxyacylglutathione hydrolase [Saprospiraceae bacterium]|jgi:hydroxyacylglutathione hydrolase
MIVYEDASLTIFQSALYQTNSLIYNAASFILLVDPNWLSTEVQFIRDYVDLKHKGKAVYILFTHSDFDHILGYGLFPEAKVIASERFQNSISKEKVIEEIHSFDQQHYIKRAYPITYPEVDLIISKDGEQLSIEGERFTFYLSPGHTNDGLFTIIESAGIFISGDYLSDLEFPFIYHNIGDYENTLRKVDTILQSHLIHLMIPGHGNYIKDKNSEILVRRDRDLRYIQDLKNSIKNKTPFPLANWLRQFPYPDGLKEEHFRNEKLGI